MNKDSLLPEDMFDFADKLEIMAGKLRRMASELRHPDQDNASALCRHMPVCWFLERGPCETMRNKCKSYKPLDYSIEEAFDFIRDKYGQYFDGIDVKKYVDALRGKQPDNNSQPD